MKQASHFSIAGTKYANTKAIPTLDHIKVTRVDNSNTKVLAQAQTCTIVGKTLGDCITNGITLGDYHENTLGDYHQNT
jgi:hypothetical protein